MKRNKLLTTTALILIAIFALSILRTQINFANAQTTNDTFTTYQEVYGNFSLLCDNVNVWNQSLGQTVKGNTIYAYFFGANATGKPLVMMDSAICGYEYETATLLYNFGQWLKYTPMGQALMSNVQYMIVPVIDVDEFANSRMNDNQTTNYGPVCLNRNFPLYWGDGAVPNGSLESSTPEHYNGVYPDDYYQQYIGGSPASEIETKDMINAWNTYQPSMFFDYHVGGADLNPNPDGQIECWSYPGETTANTTRLTNFYTNDYAPMATAYSIDGDTYGEVTDTYNSHWNGTSSFDVSYALNIPSWIVETWDYNGLPSHPTSDDLNGTMLNEVECLGLACNSYLGFNVSLELDPDCNSVVNLTPSSLTNWECVSTLYDLAKPNDNNYVCMGNTGQACDSYNLGQGDAFGLNIVSVTVYFRCEKIQVRSTSCNAFAYIEVDSSYFSAGSASLTTSWTTYSYTWTTCPATNQAWTTNDIASLDGGVGLYTANGINAEALCNWVYVLVVVS
jgi:hypothetical protein